MTNHSDQKATSGIAASRSGETTNSAQNQPALRIKVSRAAPVTIVMVPCTNVIY